MTVEPQSDVRRSSGEMAWAAGALMDVEARLVAAARRGESAAFEGLLARYEARIFRLAQNITKNREDAEEVVQDAFTRAFTRLDTFHGDSRFSTWLTRIAINQALMKLRRHRPNLVPLDEMVETEDGSLPREIADWGPNPEQRYSQQELQAILAAATDQLSPSLRIVFQLRDVEQLSIQETAEALGLSASAVKSRLLRARLELRERLSERFRLRRDLRSASSRHTRN
ncbi:MAG: sigma-70 family RNA polymerase sigma factor [Candidatus Acidiferrales bacterium]